MPASHPALSLADAHDLAAAAGFPHRPVSTDDVGVELEWLIFRAGDPDAAVAEPEVRAALGPRPSGADLRADALPAGGRITFEPGGQLELSSPPAATVGAAIGLAATDAATIALRLGRHGLRPVALGLDPARARRRVLDTARYRAMAEHFARAGHAGASMMCSTASLQVNVGLGAHRPERRWALAHDLGPALGAAFANSPLCGRGPSGWHSTRLAVWQAIDPSRTTAVGRPGDARPPGAAWASYALDAQVMLIRLDGDRCIVPAAPMTFADWVTRGHPAGYPTADDLAYHLTTLFPPVRPRGWLELRMLDALPDPWWRVAAAVTAGLLLDADAPDALAAALAPTRDRWLDAARAGLQDRDLARAAGACFDHVLGTLGELDLDGATVAAVHEYRDRFVRRGRTPADDVLDEWSRTGDLVAPAVAEEARWT
jgi:glutamate--cysteine ligase